MKAVDIVLVPAKNTKYDAGYVMPPVGFGSTRIDVKYIDKLDDNMCPPESRGRRECERVGYHSWFHHASDKQMVMGNLPEGFVEP